MQACASLEIFGKLVLAISDPLNAETVVNRIEFPIVGSYYGCTKQRTDLLPMSVVKPAYRRRWLHLIALQAFDSLKETILGYGILRQNTQDSTEDEKHGRHGK